MRHLEPSAPELSLRVVDVVAVSLWLGGLITIGAFEAPIAFSVMRHSADLASAPALQIKLAAAVVGGSLRVYNVVALVCGAWLTTRLWLLSTGAALPRRLLHISPSAVTILITLVQVLALFPALDSLQSLGDRAAFDRMHHGYELLSQLQIVLLIATVVSYVMLANRRIILDGHSAASVAR